MLVTTNSSFDCLVYLHFSRASSAARSTPRPSPDNVFLKYEASVTVNTVARQVNYSDDKSFFPHFPLKSQNS